MYLRSICERQLMYHRNKETIRLKLRSKWRGSPMSYHRKRQRKSFEKWVQLNGCPFNARRRIRYSSSFHPKFQVDQSVADGIAAVSLKINDICRHRGAVRILNSESNARRTRQLDISFQYSGQRVLSGRSQVQHNETFNLLAEMFTKASPTLYAPYIIKEGVNG